MHCEVIGEPEAGLIRNGSNVFDKSSLLPRVPGTYPGPTTLEMQLGCRAGEMSERLTELLISFEDCYISTALGCTVFTARCSSSRNVVSGGLRGRSVGG